MPNQLSNIRNKKMRKQSGQCYYCDQPMWINNLEAFAAQFKLPLKQAAQLKCTAEHLTARSEGGGNDYGNIVAACLYCNRHRHLKKEPPNPDRYRAFVRNRLTIGKWHGAVVKELVGT